MFLTKFLKVGWKYKQTDNLTLKNYRYQLSKFNIEDRYKLMVKVLQSVLIDFSYKKDMNLLLPVTCKRDNLRNIDYYNQKTYIQGLIKFKINDDETSALLKFDDLFNSIEIEELFLRENIFNIYKDFILEKTINQNSLKKLLKKTLKDGIFYEKL